MAGNCGSQDIKPRVNQTHRFSFTHIHSLQMLHAARPHAACMRMFGSEDRSGKLKRVYEWNLERLNSFWSTNSVAQLLISVWMDTHTHTHILFWSHWEMAENKCYGFDSSNLPLPPSLSLYCLLHFKVNAGTSQAVWNVKEKSKRVKKLWRRNFHQLSP